MRIAAKRRELQLKLLDAIETHRESGDFEDLCKMTAAQRELETYEAKLEQLSELRRSLYAKRAAAKAAEPTQPPAPAEQAEEALPGQVEPTVELLEVLFGRPEIGGGTTRQSPYA